LFFVKDSNFVFKWAQQCRVNDFAFLFKFFLVMDAKAANADHVALQRRWNKLQQSAVQPVSAMELLESDSERKKSAKRCDGQQTKITTNIDEYEGGCTKNSGPCQVWSDVNSASSASCLLQNPLLSLPIGSLTEIAGPAGAGKTQMALTMCADCAWEGGKAVYVGLGGSGSYLHKLSRRLKGMLEWRLIGDEVEHQQVRPRPKPYVPNSNEFIQGCLNRIFVRGICNSDELFEMLHASLPKLLQFHTPHVGNDNSKISLVILDGIANLFRVQEDSTDVASKWHQHRALVFFQISNLCKELSAIFQVPFLVINGATNRLDRGIHKPVLEPALGLAWSQCVNSSFFVERLPESFTKTEAIALGREGSMTHQKQDLGNPRITAGESYSTREVNVCYRRLCCLKAPHVPSRYHQDFYIDQRGVFPA
jgi:RecA/RadA recombinase